MEKDNYIKCPGCGTLIDVNEVLYHQLEESIRFDYESRIKENESQHHEKLKQLETDKNILEQEKSRLSEKIEAEVQDKLKSERIILEKSIREKVNSENDEQLNNLRKELDEKSVQVKEMNRIQGENERLKREKDELRETVSLEKEKEFSEKLKDEKSKLELTLREKIHAENNEQLDELRKELDAKSEQVKQMNKLQAEMERLKREKEELRDSISLEKEREFSDKLKDEKSRIRKQVDDENILKIREKEKVIDELKSQLDEAKRKAEQGSMQLQGEIQELELENMLRSLYPYDDINEIKKGQRGADLIQSVKTNNGMECGKIYYESKRTKNFDNNWLQKLRDDNLSMNADILVLVTEAMPEGVDKFVLRDGVWICSFNEVKGLSLVLRYALLQVQEVAVVQQGKDTKMEMLYGYLTSQEFRGQFEAIIEGFKSIQDSYAEEKLKMQKIWKEREKQLEKILTNAVSFYGSLKGIAGASIPDIKMLE